MDACFMSMGEVAWEISEYVNILVGAEGLEPAFGWPYGRILADAKANRGANQKGLPMDPRQVARAIVKGYVEHYADYDRAAGRSVDLAAIDLRRFKNVKDSFKRTCLHTQDPHGCRQARGAAKAADARAISDSGQRAEAEADAEQMRRASHHKIVLAHWYAQTYKSDQFVDLRDLCVQIGKQFGPGDVRDRCNAVIKALSTCVISSGCSGFAYQHSHGVSIYFPWAMVSADYKNVKFASDTRWEEFLQDHILATQREARFPSGSQTFMPSLRLAADRQTAVGKQKIDAYGALRKCHR